MNSERRGTYTVCEHEALREAVESGQGFRDAAETESVARWALAEIERLKALRKAGDELANLLARAPGLDIMRSAALREWMAVRDA